MAPDRHGGKPGRHERVWQRHQGVLRPAGSHLQGERAAVPGRRGDRPALSAGSGERLPVHRLQDRRDRRADLAASRVPLDRELPPDPAGHHHPGEAGRPAAPAAAGGCADPSAADGPAPPAGRRRVALSPEGQPDGERRQPLPQRAGGGQQPAGGDRQAGDPGGAGAHPAAQHLRAGGADRPPADQAARPAGAGSR